jgi:hypothetical protein
VDLDLAMDVVESICVRKPSATVMVYSSRPTASGWSGDARRREGISAASWLLTFSKRLWSGSPALAAGQKGRRQHAGLSGAKGGSGVTTLATNRD